MATHHTTTTRIAHALTTICGIHPTIIDDAYRITLKLDVNDTPRLTIETYIWPMTIINDELLTTITTFTPGPPIDWDTIDQWLGLTPC
jgi:hypothetical protein